MKLLQYVKDLNLIAEVGWEEKKTTDYIISHVDKKPYKKGFGKNKVGVIYKYGEGTQSIFLRADIDALPTEKGPKHICGHSTHTGSLLYATELLKQKEEELAKNNKSVYCIFQPAEETFPSGAATIIDEFPEMMTISYGFGMHVSPELQIGEISLQNGVISSAGDYIEIVVEGKAVHVKSAHEGIDAIEGASYVIQEVKNFQKQFADFGKNVVFNLNTITGGTAPNIVADKVFMNGDIRWFNTIDSTKIRDFFEKLPQKLSKKYNGNIKVTYYVGYPPLINDESLTDKIAKIQQLSRFTIIRKNTMSLGIEDFSFYTKFVPSTYVRIGTGGKFGLHDKDFAVPAQTSNDAYDYWKAIIEWWI